MFAPTTNHTCKDLCTNFYYYYYYPLYAHRKCICIAFSTIAKQQRRSWAREENFYCDLLLCILSYLMCISQAFQSSVCACVCVNGRVEKKRNYSESCIHMYAFKFSSSFFFHPLLICYDCDFLFFPSHSTPMLAGRGNFTRDLANNLVLESVNARMTHKSFHPIVSRSPSLLQAGKKM